MVSFVNTSLTLFGHLFLGALCASSTLKDQFYPHKENFKFVFFLKKYENMYKINLNNYMSMDSSVNTSLTPFGYYASSTFKDQVYPHKENF